MNDQVREEIEDLQQTHGFEENEAVAYWHLRQLWSMLVDMRRTDDLKLASRREERGEEYRFASILDNRADIESNVLQHLSALRRELAYRVLRRHFPNGWGKPYKAADEEEN